MSYDDRLSTTNYPRYQARELVKAIYGMSPERRETLATLILFQKPLMDRNVELAAHIAALLQGERPHTSLEKLLRERQPSKQLVLASIFPQGAL